MTDYYSKKSGQLHIQIPVFGDWDNANQLPITQYFASATQAGLIRYSSSSGECAPTVRRRESHGVDSNKKGPTNSHQTKTAKAAASAQIGNAEKKHKGKAFYVAEPLLKVYDDNHHSPPPKPPKPVDEDLYKIPPDQLKKHHKSKRNKVLRVLSRCLMPACNS